MADYRFAVLGDPIEHSRSPELHKAMLEITGLDGDYLRIRADGAVLETAVSDLHSGVWDGLNITMPLKGDAARLADSLSPRAAIAGSVNTLSRTGPGIAGDSTDITALQELDSSGRFDSKTSVLVLGAGGAAAATLVALDDRSHVYISSRRRTAAEEISTRLGGEVVSWEAAVVGALVINATPIGMAGEHLPDGVLEHASGLIDLAYGSETTPAVREAERLGIPYADGHEVLLRQAIASFTIWTGIAVDLNTLTETLRKD